MVMFKIVSRSEILDSVLIQIRKQLLQLHLEVICYPIGHLKGWVVSSVFDVANGATAAVHFDCQLVL